MLFFTLSLLLHVCWDSGRARSTVAHRIDTAMKEYGVSRGVCFPIATSILLFLLQMYDFPRQSRSCRSLENESDA